MAIKMICSDIDGTLLQYGRKKLEGEIFDQIRALHDRGILFCPASGRSTPACACCLRRWPAAVFPVRERRRAVQGRALHRREPNAPRTGGGNRPRPVGPQRRPGRGHALGPELRLSDGARPRYAGPHPIYRQPLQGHLRPVRDPRGDRQGVGLPA